MYIKPAGYLLSLEGEKPSLRIMKDEVTPGMVTVFGSSRDCLYLTHNQIPLLIAGLEQILKDAGEKDTENRK